MWKFHNKYHDWKHENIRNGENTVHESTYQKKNIYSDRISEFEKIILRIHRCRAIIRTPIIGKRWETIVVEHAKWSRTLTHLSLKTSCKQFNVQDSSNICKNNCETTNVFGEYSLENTWSMPRNALRWRLWLRYIHVQIIWLVNKWKFFRKLVTKLINRQWTHMCALLSMTFQLPFVRQDFLHVTCRTLENDIFEQLS